VIPFGGSEILKARVAGKRPAEMVIFSLVGPIPGIENPVTWVGIHQDIHRLELGYLADLDVEVATSTKVPFARLLEAIRAVEAHANGVFCWWRDVGMTTTIRWTRGARHITIPRLEDVSDPRVRQFARDVYKRLVRELDK
jgi:hypothetical protein